MSIVCSSPLIGYDHKPSSSPSSLSSSLNKKTLSLPHIEHPSKRIDDDNKNSLDIRGRSRNGHGDGQLIRNEYSMEDLNNHHRHHHRRSSSMKYNSSYSQPLFDIPENNTLNGGQDRGQVRLPIFGKILFVFVLFIYLFLLNLKVIEQIVDHHHVIIIKMIIVVHHVY